jgi:hypothetical protein
MNSLALKLLIIVCLIFQYGCAIKFKRKSPPPTTDKPVEMIQYEKLSEKQVDDKDEDKDKPHSPEKFTEKDALLISSYYSDKANHIIRQDMIAHTQVTRKQEEKLVVDEFIPRDLQIIPLPLSLERSLSALPLHLIRVHIGKRIIIMNVKSRQILDIIKI